MWVALASLQDQIAPCRKLHGAMWSCRGATSAGPRSPMQYMGVCGHAEGSPLHDHMPTCRIMQGCMWSLHPGTRSDSSQNPDTASLGPWKGVQPVVCLCHWVLPLCGLFVYHGSNEVKTILQHHFLEIVIRNRLVYLG